MLKAYLAMCRCLDRWNWRAACRRIAQTKGNHMKQKLIRFVKDNSGATAIEYGLIAGIVSLAIITALLAFGTDLAAVFDNISGNMAVPAGG